MSFKDLYSFYRSKEWEEFRQQILIERTGPDGLLRCEKTGEPILKKYDAIVHHKVELTEENVRDYSISLNPENVMVVSHRAHNEIHERFNGCSRKVYLVYGAPCAGKTTWVLKVARPDDLIVDIDRIWEAVCGSDRLHKPGRLKANVFGIRDCMIDQIRIRKGNWRSAYVIGTYPLETDRTRMCDLLGAEVIYIDATEEECLTRAPSEEWKGYIQDWFQARG